MSAKLLYSLSDDNPKQLGCINGFLQHFLSGRAVNGQVVHHHKRLPPGSILIKGQDKMEFKDTRDQEPKEKTSLKKNNKETSMTSSCSSASSSLSPSRALEERTLQGESSTKDMGMKEPKSSINSHQLSVRSSRKQQMISNVMKHIDSPRPLQPSNLQNQKPSDSTPTNTAPRTQNPSSVQDKKNKPHARRLSYDGRETRESIKSSLKLNELPRLSLDSRQGRTKSASVSELKSDFLQVEEPGSSRPVSSVVAKLMGLEDLLQSTPSCRADQNRSRGSEDLDFSSRTTRSTDESDTDSERHSVSIYREIDKRLGELDFRKSGKDLRALKHILDAMQRTKSKMEADSRAPESMNSIKISQYVNLEQLNGQKKSDSSSRAADKGANKLGKVSRSPSKPTSCTFQQQTPSNLPRVRTGQAANAKPDGVEKRRAKDSSPKTQQKCGKLEKFSQERRARSAMMTPNQEPKNPTKTKTQSSRQTIEARARKVVPRKLVLDDQCDMAHTPRPSQKLYKTMGPGANVNEESMTVVKEQPSPVSVLDADFCGDESLSPVKKKAIAFQDDDTSPVSARVEWIAVDTRSIISSYNTGKSKETPNSLWLGREMSEERSPVQAKGSYRSIEDENDFLTSIIAKDLARRSESWTDFSSENSWLVLDIERLLFKDLIVELLHDKTSC